MKLDFHILVVDDDPGSVEEALGVLSDYLEQKGFFLEQSTPDELNKKAIRHLARDGGRNLDLVIVDYNLGLEDLTGADVAELLRRQLPYTDIIFYSSDRSLDLIQELAKKKVQGVFVGERTTMGRTLVGVADTIIGKAIDLNHMRGIAMAEVAEMDVMMEEVLERVFGCQDDAIAEKAARTLEGLQENAQLNLDRITALAAERQILAVVSDTQMFGSANRYQAINRVAKVLAEKPSAALEILKSYDPDVIQNRNTLAHAKADTDADGNTTLRAARRGKAPISINDEWMSSFRSNLRNHKGALVEVCRALNLHIDGIISKQSK